MFKLAPQWLPRTAIISGLLGILCFVALPFLPVKHTQSSYSWPQDEAMTPVAAPLMSFRPLEFEATVPLEGLGMLRDKERLVLGTVAPDSPLALSDALLINTTQEGGLDVTINEDTFFELSEEQLRSLPANAQLKISSDYQSTVVEIPGTTLRAETSEDNRPMVMGVYTEMDGTPANTAALTQAGLRVDVKIDSRFTSSPTLLKWTVLGSGVLFLVVALWSLRRLDLTDERRIPLLPEGALRPRGADVGIVGVLTFWHIFGANTSDDGFILTMARVFPDAGYMANFYRWLGAPESPFGWPYYNLLALFAQISPSSPWMRVPAYLAALLLWFLLSRFLLPYLLGAVGGAAKRGAAKRHHGHADIGRHHGEAGNRHATEPAPLASIHPVVYWAAAFLMLAFWLPYNNGIRPESMVATGTVTSWVLFERGIATRRLFPAAIGLIIATLTLGTGPTGLMAVAAFLVCFPPLLRVMHERVDKLSGMLGMGRGVLFAALLAPFLPAGTFILAGIFHGQTWASVMESIAVRSTIGPSVPWYEEMARYTDLGVANADGSAQRRFPVFIFVTCAVIVAFSLRRMIEQRLVNATVTYRLLFIVGASFVVLVFTPTKWTHHFGTFAGVGPALAALATVAIAMHTRRSRRARYLLPGVFAVVLAFSAGGPNAWWYIYGYGVPWYPGPNLNYGVILIVPAILLLLIGAGLKFRAEYRDMRGEPNALDDAPQPLKRPWLPASSVAVVCAIAVLFTCGSFLSGFLARYPAYTAGLGNLRAFTGNQCHMGSDILIEKDTQDSFLEPVNSSFEDSLRAGPSTGFRRYALPEDVSSIKLDRTLPPRGPGNEQPAVWSSWRSASQVKASMESDWYRLPAPDPARPVIVVTTAGRVEHTDVFGDKEEGATVRLEYGKLQADGRAEKMGEEELYHIDGEPDWRDLRIAREDLPAEADVVRIVAKDDLLGPDKWVAVTPPRMPELTPMGGTFNASTPALLDWVVALQFPCQRSLQHYAGVAEIPRFRVAETPSVNESLAKFHAAEGGGILAIPEATNQEYVVATYLKDAWDYDWGTLYEYVPRKNSQQVVPLNAKLTLTEEVRSGLWSPGPMHITEKMEQTL